MRPNFHAGEIEADRRVVTPKAGDGPAYIRLYRRARSRYTVLELIEHCGVEQPGSSSGLEMDTKLKADIAESAVATELLKRGFRVLKPVGDRLPYDLALDLSGALCRIQVKAAWFDRSKGMYAVDARRTKTNRRVMRRERYSERDFDFAILYLEDRQISYIMPASVFNRYRSTVSLVETEKRQRKPMSAEYRERWDLLSTWAPQLVTTEDIPVKFGEPFTGNPEPSPVPVGAGKV